MNKSKIEWCNYTCNPVRGICKRECEYCYAIRMYKRFKWNPEIRYDENAFKRLEKISKGSKVFIGSMHDVFGEWIPDEWINNIIEKTKMFPDIIFMMLTKNPKRYSDFDFPKNVWIGYSTIGVLYHRWGERHEGNIKFVSIEPMGEPLQIRLNGYAQYIDFNWLILGAETGNRKDKYILQKEWMHDVINFADKIGIPLFIKNNAGGGRQEYPGTINKFNVV